MNEYEKQHIEMLRFGLAECTVLLKKDSAFPLKKPCKIAAYGSGVRHTIKGGTGSSEVNSRYFVTIEQGLKDAGFEVTTQAWLASYDGVLKQARIDFIADVKRRARQQHTNAMMLGMGAVMPQPEYHLPLDAKGEAAIYVLSRISGEGNDRKVVPGDFLLTETEIRDILELSKKFERFMLVLNVGGPVDLTPVLEVQNILLLSQLGVETGKTLADLLLGKAVPGGKLTTTWAKAEAYPNVGSFGELNDTVYKEGIYVGYRWFDACEKTAIFPFGFGLGYTAFSLEEIVTSANGSEITVRLCVRNTGQFPGKEVVQVYLSAPEAELDKPVKELVAFGKTKLLQPGESQTLEVSFDLCIAASYSQEKACYLLEAGDYVLQVGSSATAKATAVLQLDREVCVRKVKNCLGTVEFTDFQPAKKKAAAPTDLPVIPLDAKAFNEEETDYLSHTEPTHTEPTHTELTGDVAEMSLEALCYMNVGGFDPKAVSYNVLGSAAQKVAGAAGESTGQYEERKIPRMIMADGPAGVRISPKFYRDKKGLHSVGPGIMDNLVDFMPGLVAWFMKRPKKIPKTARLEEQYCTAIPIGTAIAQSWNLNFAETCGDVVGSEMERFGIHLWLAPALNIHRSPLCGRNFEYFSEDPIVSGLFAAAITQGVQKHPGRGVTIKHYAANNQETNRYFSNSAVSERGMREIYLKGFAICIRTAPPKAVMSSYNLLNGTHTSEHRALCTDILRGEFGFEGVCMTDWVVAGLNPAPGSKYSVPDPALVAAAGGDLFMPGSKKDYQRLLEGAKCGRVSIEQLRMNASRVARLAKELAD